MFRVDWSGRVPHLGLASVNARISYLLLAINRVITSYLLNRELSNVVCLVIRVRA